MKADDAFDAARLIVAWTEIDQDAAVRSSFASLGAALDRLTQPALDVKMWVEITCMVDPDEGVIRLKDEHEEAKRTPEFALLCSVGNQLAPEDGKTAVPRLFNTLKALSGERAIARMVPARLEAESWLLAPRVPSWVLAPPLGTRTTKVDIDESRGVTDDAGDGVIVFSTTRKVTGCRVLTTTTTRWMGQEASRCHRAGPSRKRLAHSRLSRARNGRSCPCRASMRAWCFP